MSKIVNIYIVFDLDAWPRNQNSFKFKNCLFGGTSVVKKNVHSGFVITFDSARSWSFDNDIARNVYNICC